MSDIKIQPSATGSATVTLTAPATGTARTVTLPDGTGSLIADNGSGSLGIGTSSPARPLEVKDSSDQANIRLQGSVGYCDLSGNGGNGSDFVVLTEGTEKFRVKESGGVRATDGMLCFTALSMIWFIVKSPWVILNSDETLKCENEFFIFKMCL